MAALSPKRVPQSAAIVFCFWGFIFWVYNADKPADPTLAISVAIACFIATALAKSESISYRSSIRSNLSKEESRGVISSIGPVPFHTRKISLNKLLDTSLIRAHYPPEFRSKENDLIASYFSKYELSHPHYADLFDAILRLLTAPEHVIMPATYACDGTADNVFVDASAHGNRSLLMHSILVYDVMMSEAPQYADSYTPDRPKRANNPLFKPDKNDPLIGILGLAHDIGKLRTFELIQHENKLVARKIKRHHDAEGSRVISLLDAFWNPNIPAEDRAIIQNVMAFYHHPSDLPIKPAIGDQSQEKYSSDRETALLWLLVKCDRMAGAIEHGESYEKARGTVLDLNLKVDLSNNSQETIVESFIRFLASTSSVNSKAGRSVAFKATKNDKTFLIFDEKEFIDNYADFIGKPEFKAMKTSGNNPHPVSSNLLKILDPLGVVHRVETDSNSGMAAELCLYSIDFFDPNEDGSKPSLVLSSAFILDISQYDILTRFKGMPDCHSRPEFGRRRFGARGLERKSMDDSIVADIFAGVDSEEPFGISILSIPKRKLRTPKIKSPALARKLISEAIALGKLIPAKEFEVNKTRVAAFSGVDEWFIENIGPMDLMTNPKFMSDCKILEIKPSAINADQHVIVFAID